MPVYIKKISSYSSERIGEELEKALKALDFSLHGRKSAVLKPNLVLAASPGSGVITHPAVTEAVINVLKKEGVAEIAILEGSGLGHVTKEVFRKTGYQALAEKHGIRILAIDDCATTTVRWRYGKLTVPTLAMESDLYINLPKMKTHGLTSVSLAVKNQKGLVPPLYKKVFHNLGLHEPIAEFQKILAPHLVVLDGIEGMEGEGPVRGRKVKPNVLLVGTSAVESDVAALKLMGIGLDEVKHLKAAVDQNQGSAEPVLLGDRIEDLAVQFSKANLEWGRMLKVCSKRNPHACSMCVDSLMSAVQMAVKNPVKWGGFVAKFGYYALFEGIYIIQGMHSTFVPKKGWPVCFGKCTREHAKAHGFAHVPGCPPDPQDILNFFFTKLSDRL